MKRLPTSVIALTGFCLLAACGPKGAGSNAPSGGASGAASAPSSGPDVAINLADLPRARAGLWQTTIDSGDGHPGSVTSCASGKAPAIGKGVKECNKVVLKRTVLGDVVMDMSCTTPAFTMTSHMVATGDFETHITSDTVMSMKGVKGPPTTSKVHTEAHWLGPCPPGQKPDELETANG